MSTLEAHAQSMLESSVLRLAELRTKAKGDPEDEQAWLDIIVEGARNETLRVLLNRTDDAVCNGIDD